MIIYNPLDGDAFTSTIPSNPRHCFLMTRLGLPIPEPVAESALSYLSCRLTRFLIFLHKPSQDTTRKVYTFVPTQDLSKKWVDESLYNKYELSETEIEFIEKIVRPMEIANSNGD